MSLDPNAFASLDLNALALKAKTCEDAFQETLKRVEPMCRRIAYRYACWMADRDEIFQWARIEVWNAVKSFEPGKMSFFSYCKLTVENHIKSRLRRLYGQANVPNRTAMRLDGPTVNEDGVACDTSYLEGVIENPGKSTYQILLRKDSLQNIRTILKNENLTPLEYNCLVLFYFEECSHLEIQNILELPSRKAVDNALTRVRRKLAKNQQLQEIFEVLSAQAAM
ncbi:sigma-70 family RNA polymerase sigma factor [Effusibacillus pohliae]|uniref:sigma-70 family RNA polymerase sigma factor n=1 Tax=Effusibacillus pohliae TaxID=232270 RepID=UPI00036291F2|nr:sigma-70 family RNA polymerase sigma factor [Effusibacillus pohliae]